MYRYTTSKELLNAALGRKDSEWVFTSPRKTKQINITLKMIWNDDIRCDPRCDSKRIMIPGEVSLVSWRFTNALQCNHSTAALSWCAPSADGRLQIKILIKVREIPSQVDQLLQICRNNWLSVFAPSNILALHHLKRCCNSPYHNKTVSELRVVEGSCSQKCVLTNQATSVVTWRRSTKHATFLPFRVVDGSGMCYPICQLNREG